MMQTLLLVDYENVPKVDLSVLDEGYRAVIFVGKNQEHPKAARMKSTAHRFARVDFLKIDGNGKNALDFHIAFHLGRIFETAPDTECVVIAKDKGYDPLLRHLNKNGLKCSRIEGWEQFLSERGPVLKPVEAPAVLALASSPMGPSIAVRASGPFPNPELTVCPRCKKASTIAHHGGRWCSNCGSFAVAADPKLLPSSQQGLRPNDRWSRGKVRRSSASGAPGPVRVDTSLSECGWCHQQSDMAGGIYDDGEWMCGQCVAGYAT